jgi:O-antigen ligase
MIRLSALWLTVIGLAAYARKDWYVSLCGLILLMAVIEHPDAPKTIFGIQGLNFWNLLLVVVVWGWLVARRREGLTWDPPQGVGLLFVLYLGVMCSAFARMITDRSYLDGMSVGTLVSEYLVNTLKWLVPGVLLFDGCRSRRRFYLGVGSVLAVYVLLGLYVIKWMPFSLLTNGEALQQRALKILVNEIGYHRVTMSMMLAGASWAVFSARWLVTNRRHRQLMFAAAGAIVFAQALTGGRMGYVTWAIIGLTLLTIRDRAFLLLGPVVVAAVFLIVPAAGERLLQGFDPSTSVYSAELDRRTDHRAPIDRSSVDLDTVTAGRTLIWPYVEQKIMEAPILGYGMLAMRRTGLTTFLDTSLGEGFDHPHNAYLEMLLDNGVIGFLLVLPFYAVVVWCSLRLYADSRSPVFIAAGGVTAALVLALLVAGLGSQSFYPREGSVCMWCAIGLMFRVWVQRGRLLTPQAKPAPGPPRAVIAWPGGGGGSAPARDNKVSAPVLQTIDIEAQLWPTP